MRQRPIGDMLSQQFAPFDHRSKVVAPFDDETKRDAAFIESEYMLDRSHHILSITALMINRTQRHATGAHTRLPCVVCRTSYARER